MATILILLAIISGTVLVVVVVMKVKEAGESRKRRTVATPYGVMMAPTDAELRSTREVHPPDHYDTQPYDVTLSDRTFGGVPIKDLPTESEGENGG